MKNTLYDSYSGPRITKKKAKKRIMKVLSKELTLRQREAIYGYYILQKNIPTLAEERGVHKSTISRNLARGEQRLRQYLQY